MTKGWKLAALLALWAASPAAAVVFINEVVTNPPGSASASDRFFEYIELMGTPGKKLDGYALAFVNGGLQKVFPAGAALSCPYEIDEFYSLDGLALGTNGILVVGKEFAFDYPDLLDDSAFVGTIIENTWNGHVDAPGNLNNDGSTTVMLIRNRPGATEANNPTPPPSPDLRWGKDTNPGADCEYFPNAIEDPPGTFFDQWGDGNIDRGNTNGFGGTDTLDMKGATTPEADDDLEVVDEVSWEQDQGWEYDVDGRQVDFDSPIIGLPERNVHALDDPQGFNPDAISRVDYRTKGPGWLPAPGATGQLPNGNNWQDTATEQWIRGELKTTTGGGVTPPYFYVNTPNANPDSIQPFRTNVPLWLDDGIAPDFDFTTVNFYRVSAGRINPLATPFIPGDADRDGDCDADDIDKIRAVFGDDDWIFSNSFGAAPEGDDGDPATQTRPWDVDATGDNGIEASDLQWTLNFQGDTTGQVVGVQYDSPTPAAAGVVLNPNAGVLCNVTLVTNLPNGRPLAGLHFGDPVELTVRGQVTSGANMAAGQQNGIMQFVHDLEISAGGVLRVQSIETLGAFDTTRASLQTAEGDAGDLGTSLINGFTTSFAEGLTGADPLYRVTLRAVGTGSASVSVFPAAEIKFADSTPHGLKVGHTMDNGNPASASYPGPVAAAVVAGPGDSDADGDVDLADYANFADCLTGPDGGILPDCDVFNFDFDNDVDLEDFETFQSIFAP